MFKKVPILLKGYKSEKFALKELSIAKAKKVMAKEGDDLDVLLAALEHSLIYEDGERVITDKYTLEDFEDDIPQSYLLDLADAYKKLNDIDEIDIAKKS
jgi:hypothetical protein